MTDSDTPEGLEELIRMFTELRKPEYQQVLHDMAADLTAMYKKNMNFYTGKKLIIFGNGGSAEQASHMIAELSIRYSGKRKRPSLPAIALTDVGALTAGANDFGYEQVFSRQVEGLVNADDVVLGISTSGKSPNVLRALETAKRLHAITMAFTGKDGMRTPVDYCFAVPATETSVIQTGHLYAIHWICEHIDKKLAIKE